MRKLHFKSVGIKLKVNSAHFEDWSNSDHNLTYGTIVLLGNPWQPVLRPWEHSCCFATLHSHETDILIHTKSGGRRWKIIIFKWSAVPRMEHQTPYIWQHRIYDYNHTDRQLLHTRSIRKYVFMTMQYRQSLNGRKYIQLTQKYIWISTIKSYVAQCLGSCKTADVNCSISRLVLNTFTLSISLYLCRAYNMNQFTQCVNFSRHMMKYKKIEGVKIAELCMRNRQKSSHTFYDLCYRIYIKL